MRTVILTGLYLVAECLNPEHFATIDATFLAYVLIAAIIWDVIYLLFKK